MWEPSPESIAASNLCDFWGQPLDYHELWRWSAEHRAEFWGRVVARLGVVFASGSESVLGNDGRWFPDGRLNIVDSCFTAPGSATAIIHRSAGRVHRVSFDELRALVGRAAAGFASIGLVPGDRVAIAMPMNLEAVVAYLGVAAAGGVVVSIADSFASDEIASRLRITGTDTVVTSGVVERSGKVLPMLDKVVAAGAARAVVVGDGSLRATDIGWDEFCSHEEPLVPVPLPSDAHLNILFSSGTTGDPKAIPWTHLTPIKSAMDGHFHQDIHPGDIVAWPTNLGWMMGPWLIFASLINGAAMALYDDAPTTSGFTEFVEEAGVTMLGVVPSLVAAWRATGIEADWSAIRAFSSTGEASSPEDMEWLMHQAGGKPVIEYCGGTEIGGGYLTGTVVQTARPGMFSTPALGLDVAILDEAGRPTDTGELFIVGPSVGLSTELLNRDHNDVYFTGVPRPGLRRHGDHMERLEGGYFRAHGRIDDTMNLGGIKVSSAEIERVVVQVDGVTEAAAVAETPAVGGPDRLVIFVVPAPGPHPDPESWRTEMQRLVAEHLNPLFRIAAVVPIDELPRTASAKVMRRILRSRPDPPSPGGGGPMAG